MKTQKNLEHTLETQLSPTEVDTNKVRATLGMLSSSNSFAPILLSLKQIEEFVEQRIIVFVQRGLGIEHDISDYQFTEYGADIMEDEVPIIALSNIILKYDPLSVDEIFFLKDKQMIISIAPPEVFTKEMVQYLNEKTITAVGLNFLNVSNSQLQDTVKQLVSALIFSNKIQHSIQLNPLFLRSVYCYKGEICNRAIAEHAGVPWKDLVELCWNRN